MRFKYEWLVVLVFVFFAVVHYVDRSLLPPLLTTIMGELGLNKEQAGLISTATLIVTTIGFIVWGYLYDKYSRVLLTTAAGVIWAFTTWLSALTRSFTDFFAARASTGIDDAATPGMYALVSDYFPPKRRSTIMGLMDLAPQVGFLIAGLVGTFFWFTLRVENPIFCYRWSRYCCGTPRVLFCERRSTWEVRTRVCRFRNFRHIHH